MSGLFAILCALVSVILAFLFGRESKKQPEETPTPTTIIPLPPERPQEPLEAPPAPVTPPPAHPPTPAPIPLNQRLLPWDMKGKLSFVNFHNVRVICDQEGLTPSQKEELCATVWGESDFDVHAKCENFVTKMVGTKDGKPIFEKVLGSTDHGICQWNDYYHGKEISAHDAEFDPEKAVRLMCAYWRRGEASKKQWVAYSSGRYRQFLGRRIYPQDEEDAAA